MTEDLRLVSRLRQVVGYRGRKRRYAVHLVLFSFVVGALLGVERMAHLEWLRDDAVLLKWLRLPSWPVRKVFSQGLRYLTDGGRSRLEALVSELGFASLGAVDSVVVDIDTTAITDHGRAEGSSFGHCGKGRNRRRHHPLVASVAETRAIVAAKYRGGANVNGPELLSFLQLVAGRVRTALGEGCTMFFRGDSGMWTHAMVQWMREQGIGFVCAQSMRADIQRILQAADWEADEDDPDLEFTVVPGPLGTRLVGVRRLDADPDAPALGKQLSWCPQYRYQALVTDRDWEAKDLWRFYNHRADCERVFRVGKQVLGLGKLVGRDFASNAAAFLLRALAFNVDLRFQQRAEERARAEGRPIRRLGLQWRQFRFYCSPGRLLRERSRWVLRVPTNPKLVEVWAFYAPSQLSRARGAPP